MTMTLILAGGGVILVAAPTVTDLGDRYDTGDGQYPKSVAVGGIQGVSSLPGDFDARYCTWNGVAVVCDFPDPPPLKKVQSITKMQFLPLLVGAIGEGRAITLLGTPTKFAVIYAAAEKIDYDDVFVMVDNDPEQPCYAAQLLAAGAATQTEVDALEASWPTG